MSCKLIRFVGGGRWASTVLSELVVLCPDLRIDWVCSSDLSKKLDFVKGSSLFKNVNLVDSKNIAGLSQPHKVIIASHSSHHCSDLLIHRNNADLLIEKPLFPSYIAFENLSDIEKNRIFFNMEFYNAYFISDFYGEVKSINFENIEIIWHDPLEENRGNGEIKHSEIFSSIFMDQLLHVMSIFKVMKIDSSDFNNINISINQDSSNGAILINCLVSNIRIKISLSRFSEMRERKIIINGGIVSLDFKSKPIIKKNGTFGKEILSLNRQFPIAKTLNDFVSYPEKSDITSLSLKSLISEINFCFACEDIFNNNFSNKSTLDVGNKIRSSDINPYLIYYAGICFYREIVNSKQNRVNHYLRGNDGVKELLDWWQNS